MNDVYIWIDVI